ncbi:MATE family efflux transporter (plasmid) [Leptospira interrogans serovar Canicola]|uniref:MATE family efflux transporter n=2 Tax=Leptospira interrogans TaxID=173 RepID=A0AAP9WG78_LEPIR|nr:MATE family efflux transporter [Leptospira interrogans]QOI45238.1 MATE family efflux transporter [Leptospira interrogans serovar Canicola]QOI53103.1 MATE family efflux transporter [Leptospira interrogans serovar Bataviae]
MKKIIELLIQGSPKQAFKDLWAASFSLTLGGLISSIMTGLDAIYLSHLSPNALNAITISSPYIGIVMSISAGLGTAISNSISRSTKSHHLRKELFASMTLTSIAMVVIGFLSYYSVEFIINSVGLHEDKSLKPILPYFEDYWYYLIPGQLLLVMFTVLLQILVAFGDTKINLILFKVCCINIILNPIFIFGLKFGCKGAALSTDLAYLFGVTFCLFNSKKYLRFKKIKYSSLILPAIYRQTKTAIVVFVGMGIWSVYGVLFNGLAASQGAAVLFAIGIYDQIQSFFATLTRGICGGFLVVFNKTLSERLYSNYVPIFVCSIVVVQFIFLIGWAISLFFPNYFKSAYGINESVLSIELATFLKFGAWLLFISGIPRISQIGFLSLDKSWLFALNSFVMIILGYCISFFLTDIISFSAIPVGQVSAHIICDIVFVPSFIFLLVKRIKKDSVSYIHR